MNIFERCISRRPAWRLPTTLVATVGLLLGLAGCDEGTGLTGASGQGPVLPNLTAQEEQQLDQEVDATETDSYGLVFYESTYQNMNIVGEVDGDPFALIAGTHSPNFPFFGDRPWDNGLLLLGEDRYEFTHRTQGRALEIDLPMGKSEGSGAIRYDGEMTRVSDGASVEVEFDIPVSFRRYDPLQLAKPYVFLDKELAEKLVGMRWQPFELESDNATVSAAGGPTRQVTGLNGELEYGILANLQAPRFAFAYDYVNVAAPGSDGYAFVDYTANPLDDSGVLGRVLEHVMHEFASATVTLDDGFERANARQVDRPPQDDPSVVLFENEVDLELAVLKRQMIETTDADGNTLYGLREIFVPKN